MASPKGTIVDLNLIKRYIDKLQRLIQRNKVAGAKTLSADINTYMGNVNTLVQAATNFATDLSSTNVLPLSIPPTDNPVVNSGP